MKDIFSSDDDVLVQMMSSGTIKTTEPKERSLKSVKSFFKAAANSILEKQESRTWPVLIKTSVVPLSKYIKVTSCNLKFLALYHPEDSKSV